MARIRTVKPEFFRHELLQELEEKHGKLKPMLVFAGLWTLCDKNGNFEWKPRLIKLDILPFITFNIDDTLNILNTSGFIVKYESDGKIYGHIPTFEEHQRISGKELQTPGKYPEPTCEMIEKLLGSNGEATEKHPESQERKGKGKERKGNGYTSLPENFSISDRVKKWAAKNKLDHLEEHLDSFKLKCQAKEYKYVDWDAAFMNAIRDNWAKVGGNGNGRGTGNGHGGFGKPEPTIIPEYTGEDLPTEEERQRGLQRLKELKQLTRGIG